ncbi:hypothetical protein B296_00006665 [Ensete ventricosum]|uniref:Uncharacterized protein n=1 Tax=Ensete ventricosum TaxID=4639 RepID=A0A426ZPQ9_ENSVE|nr:hypothetical protein B296_00006665 [Ensete ventricosum]
MGGSKVHDDRVRGGGDEMEAEERVVGSTHVQTSHPRGAAASICLIVTATVYVVRTPSKCSATGSALLTGQELSTRNRVRVRLAYQHGGCRPEIGDRVISCGQPFSQAGVVSGELKPNSDLIKRAWAAVLPITGLATRPKLNPDKGHNPTRVSHASPVGNPNRWPQRLPRGLFPSSAAATATALLQVLFYLRNVFTHPKEADERPKG